MSDARKNDIDYDENEERWPLSYSENRSEIEALEAAAHYLRIHDKQGAIEVIQSGYPFQHPVKRERTYTMREMLEVFFRDGFIDRYSGEKLVHPGMLRVLSDQLGADVFPYDSHWKTSACHPAYWKYQPTVDHITPVSFGGEDSIDNWVTTSFSRNLAKSNTAMEQLGWELKEPGDLKDWDGLTWDFLALYEENAELHSVLRIRQWYQATVEVLKNRNTK